MRHNFTEATIFAQHFYSFSWKSSYATLGSKRRVWHGIRGREGTIKLSGGHRDAYSGVLVCVARHHGLYLIKRQKSDPVLCRNSGQTVNSARAINGRVLAAVKPSAE